MNKALSFVQDFPAQSLLSDSSNKSEVQMSCEILNVLEIDDVNSYIALQFKLDMLWRDPRLKFLNLKDNSFLNTLGQDEKNKIWVPEIVFYNTEKKDESLNDMKSYIVIQREGDNEQTEMTSIHNGNIFNGEENSIVKKRVYDIKFLCNFNMEYYPFDIQTCYMQFKMKGNSGNFVNLKLGERIINSPKTSIKLKIQSIL